MTDSHADDKLTPAQHKAVSALLTEPSVRKAAEAAGVQERRLYRWLKEPDFAEAYRTARREATQQAIARLQQASGAAVSILLTLMARDTSPPAIRLAAARTVLEMAVKSVELEDLAARLEALEQKYAEKL
jgi:hypothetical protein